MMKSDLCSITDNLWIGGFPTVPVAQSFDKLILCAAEHQPPSTYFPGVHVLYAPLSQLLDGSDEARVAVQAGRAVAGWLRLGKKVLISDVLGLNRSALIAAVALMTRSIPSAQAINTVRDARGVDALLNPSLLTLLRRLEDARAFHVLAVA